MKAQIRAKTRIRGRDWADLRRPDEKKGVGGLVGRVGGDALRSVLHVEHAILTLQDPAFCQPLQINIGQNRYFGTTEKG
jgi:hypothetical protein